MDAEAGVRLVPCSEEEVSNFFDRMTSAQKRDAYRFAVKRAAACLADADELISEAFVRMWEGRRKRWADNDDLFPVLLGTIMSLASDIQFITERTRIRRMGSGKDKGKFGVIERDADHGTIAIDAASAGAGDVIDRIDTDEYRKALLADIAGDAELELLFEGMSVPFIGKDLADWMGMDMVALATVRRRFKRQMLQLGKRLAAATRER
jgi:DNA-directed RNA polymerase specialized sigma24 family protein